MHGSVLGPCVSVGACVGFRGSACVCARPELGAHPSVPFASALALVAWQTQVEPLAC